MSVEKRFELITRNLQEVICEDEEKIYYAKEIHDIVAVRNKDGIIERLISITCPYYNGTKEIT